MSQTQTTPTEDTYDVVDTKTCHDALTFFTMVNKEEKFVKSDAGKIMTLPFINLIEKILNDDDYSSDVHLLSDAIANAKNVKDDRLSNAIKSITSYTMKVLLERTKKLIIDEHPEHAQSITSIMNKLELEYTSKTKDEDELIEACKAYDPEEEDELIEACEACEPSDPEEEDELIEASEPSDPEEEDELIEACEACEPSDPEEEDKLIEACEACEASETEEEDELIEPEKVKLL
jgi:hypothetical protein